MIPNGTVSPFPHYLITLLIIAAGWAYLNGAGGEWRPLLKAVPVLCLAFWVGRRAPFVSAGLIASAFGDALLGRDTFLAGMAAFALAHVLYIAAFVRQDNRPRLWHTIPFLLWDLTAYIAISPRLGTMAAPVAGYMAVIGVMMWRSFAQAWPRPKHPLAWLGLAGAVMFGASDTLIALANWRPGFPSNGPAVMVLYWAGQAFIAAWGRAVTGRPSHPVSALPR